MVIGPGSAAFETIVALVDRLPGMICPRWVSTRTQPIALADVAAYLAGAAGRDDMLGQSFDAGGPDVMTYREMIERVARIRGKHPLIIEVPVLTPRLSSYWLRLVTPVQADVARPLIEGLRNTTVVQDDRLRRAHASAADGIRRRRPECARRPGRLTMDRTAWTAQTTPVPRFASVVPGRHRGRWLDHQQNGAPQGMRPMHNAARNRHSLTGTEHDWRAPLYLELKPAF